MVYVDTDLHGSHLRRLSRAVNWMAADQLRLEVVNSSYVWALRRMRPLPAAARLTSWACASSAASTAGTSKRTEAQSERQYMMMDVEGKVQ